MPKTLKNKNILITGAGGAAVPTLIKRLKSSGYNVTAVDMDKKAVGLMFADNSYVIPGGLDEKFLPAIEKICKEEKIDAIIPLVDEELVKICTLEENGIKTILPQKSFTELCLDKYLLMKKLKLKGILAPKTFLASKLNESPNYPIIIKPRAGRGSRGIGIIKNKYDLENYFKNNKYKLEDLIAQKYIKGAEFTVSVVAYRDGEVQAVIPKEVILKQGITKLAVTRKNAEIDEVCRLVQEKLKANGPFNVQLMINDEDKKPYIFEINPRFSTSISLTSAAGVDEMIILLEQALFNRPKDNLNVWKENIMLVRQYLDEFVDEQEYFKLLNKTKEV